MNGSVTVQVPATENYSASNRIAMYTADGSTSSMIASTGGGSATGNNSVTFHWVYSLDGNYSNDGFTGNGWCVSGYNPFSAYGNTNEEITNAIQNGQLTNISDTFQSWYNTLSNWGKSQFIAALGESTVNSCIEM